MSSSDGNAACGVLRRSDPRGRPARSLAAQLTAWYALASFALVLIVTGILYRTLVDGLAGQDDQLLLDKVHVLRSLLTAPRRVGGTIAQEIGEDVDAPRRAYVRLLSPSGAVLRESPGMAAEIPSRLFPVAGPSGTAPHSATIRSASGQPFRVMEIRLTYEAAGRPAMALVEAATEISGEEKFLAHYRAVLLAVLTAALVLCAGAGHQIVRAGLRPLRRITQAAGQIGSATLDKRLDCGGLPSELRDLAVTFNGMLDRLAASFSRLRQFSDDIAHELRTPLNSVLIATEVALGKARTIEQYREVLGSNHEDLSRLARTVQSLLFLARSENPATRIDRENLAIGRELAAVRDFFEAAATDAGIDLRLVCDPALAAATLDRSLFRRAVSNLVANALAHTPRGGFVEIAAHGNGTALRVTVSDSGCGIAPEHLPHVFDRFYRADRHRPGGGDHVGLGLSIVKGIVDLHGGSVAIESAAQAGTRIRLDFPGDAPSPGRPDDESVIGS